MSNKSNEKFNKMKELYKTRYCVILKHYDNDEITFMGRTYLNSYDEATKCLESLKLEFIDKNYNFELIQINENKCSACLIL